ncbi:hypothetical protein H9P43_006615 [Blastocladiella emersonii ATCC 22665]|nr:hypothetical protein H9P43_006615 [Blastocladiella emersonii ATCC 22665]
MTRQLPLLALLALLAAVAPARAQLLDDFSKTSFTSNALNSLGVWHGGSGVTGVTGGVAIASGGFFEELVNCKDMRGTSVVFEYTPSSVNQNIVFEYFEGCQSEGAGHAVTIKGPATKTRATATVPMATFGTNVQSVNGIQWNGPLTIHKVSIATGTATATATSTATSTTTKATTTTTTTSTSTSTSTTVKPTTTTTTSSTTTTAPPASTFCITEATDGTCGGKKVCPGGQCCSQYGWCGTTSEYCGTGCQSQCNLVAVAGVKPCNAVSSSTTATTATSSVPTSTATGTIPAVPASPTLWTVSPSLTNGQFSKDSFGMYTSCGWSRMFALTYDDGPHPTLTSQILSNLAAASYKVTFFWIGQNVRDNPTIAQQVINAGHHVAHHSWSHADFATLSAADLKSELDQTISVISPYIGGKKPRYFRPPYGSMNAAVMATLTAAPYNFRVILWDLDSNDWKTDAENPPSAILSYYQTELNRTPASSISHIALNHDIQQKAVTVAPTLYPMIKSAGFTVVPMFMCHNTEAYA